MANEITDITETVGPAWPTPNHNAVGNITRGPQPLSPADSHDWRFDPWNRLRRVKITFSTVVAYYHYDGLNRRVTRDVGTNTQHYYYSDQWQILEERLNTSSTADRQFVWGMRYVDDLVLRDKGTERFYALHDYFHPTAIIDTAGAVQERYGYDGFGTPRYMNASFGNRASSNYGWETLFGAYRYDLESGLYQVRNRYLHPKLGRWLSRDPIGYQGGINLYAYAANSPVVQIDFLGLNGFNIEQCEAILIDLGRARNAVEMCSKITNRDLSNPMLQDALKAVRDLYNLCIREKCIGCDEPDGGDGGERERVPTPVTPGGREENRVLIPQFNAPILLTTPILIPGITNRNAPPAFFGAPTRDPGIGIAIAAGVVFVLGIGIIVSRGRIIFLAPVAP
ncbi:MAG: RHS repeat-associated core domain-containing protein [Verrucomicrobiales bacterium]|nr:RHS repeat-associated core domain-containing protein [Verrucomicrobiales bacterium]